MEQRIFDWFANNLGVNLTISEYQDIEQFVSAELGVKELQAKAEGLEAENKALREYAEHKNGCDKVEKNPASHYKCTCGLYELLSQGEK